MGKPLGEKLKVKSSKWGQDQRLEWEVQVLLSSFVFRLAYHFGFIVTCKEQLS
jgi:hypothetical protein